MVVKVGIALVYYKDFKVLHKECMQYTQSHTFVEIDHEIISMVILLLLLIQEGLLSFTSESIA